MERKFTDFTTNNIDEFKQKLLYFGMKYSNFCLLENNGYQFDKTIDCIAAIGSISVISDKDKNDLEEISSFQQENKDWIFGHVAYDFKNRIEPLSSRNSDDIGFPDFLFYIPEIVVTITGNTVSFGTGNESDARKIFEEIYNLQIQSAINTKPVLTARFQRKEYLQTVAKIQEHIAKGDCYEVCFCMEYYRQNCTIDPAETFIRLNHLSPNPFAAFYKNGAQYLLCASPERFLKKEGNNLISQPIKGTYKRTGKTIISDEKETELLQTNDKERAENIMIVDLVRNDLSKICRRGSVHVRNFLDVHTFPQVHQMISTISGEIDPATTFGHILGATFPMGSMTGAPKLKAMELIDKYERTRRGLFSGTVGYIRPNGDFDFNVVIRSLLYNEENNYLSVQVGSAITAKSNAQKEFDECSIKMKAMLQSIG